MIWYFLFSKWLQPRAQTYSIKHTPDSDTFHVMTLLWNNLDIAFPCRKQNLTTVLFASVCVSVDLSI